MTVLEIKKTVLDVLEEIAEGMTESETWETLVKVPSYKTDIDLDYIIESLKKTIAEDEEEA